MKRIVVFIALLIAVLFVCSPLFAEGQKEGGSAKKAELEYWEMQWGPPDSYFPVVEQLVEQFNAEYPNIKVSMQQTPWTNWYQTFITAITSGAAPDVSTGAFPQDVMYSQMGEILPLDSIIDEWKSENNPILDDFVPGSLKLHTYEGKQVGIPWNADPRLTHYRKSYFADAGISPNPKTWDEFLAMSRAIRDKADKVAVVFPVADHGSTQVMLDRMFTNGIGIVDKDINITVEDERFIQTLQFFGTLLEQGLVPEGIAGYLGADAQKMYFSGAAAMYHHAPLQAVRDYPDVEADTGIMAPFAGPGKNAKPRNLTWLNSMMGYTQTKHPEEVKTFIKWWSENNLPLWPEGKAGPFPARMSYMNDPYFKNDWLASAIAEKIMPTSVSPVWPAEILYPEFAQIEGENYIGMALQEVMSGNSDYKMIAKDIAAKVESAFEE